MGFGSGLVEPEPDFFARMVDTIEEAVGLFDRCEIFTAPERILAQNLDRFAERVAEGRYPPASERTDLSAGEQFIVDSVQMMLAVMEGIDLSSLAASVSVGELEAKIRNLAESIRAGTYRDDPAFQALLIELNIDRRMRWRTLLRLCRQLEVVAHKQLRGVAFAEKETYLLADFGLQLASIMGYGGTSFQRPLDDTPRAVPGPGGTAGFAIGIGRPRELLVRYPFRDRYILCRGAILPFFHSQGSESMTDSQWKARLDSDERPRRPSWMQPILAPNLPEQPH